MANDETVAMYAFSKIFGFSPRLGLSLAGALGGAAPAFGCSRDRLRELVGPQAKYLEQINGSALAGAREELSRLEDMGAVFVPFGAAGYPALLAECSDPPIGLHVLSCNPPEEVFSRAAVSVVGTRDLSPYGAEWCTRIIRGLSMAPIRPVIVSGLALGVDIKAHLAALDSGLPTIAVMATGIDAVYPVRHGWAAKKIARTPGCALVTDYPPGTSPVAVNFLRRNRIIAGMSLATVLVESKIKGGGMMTANLAFSYGREVFALPGRADDLRSQGCNHLIREKVAEPVTDAESLPSRMGLGVVKKGRRADLQALLGAAYGDNPEKERLVALGVAVQKNRGISVDELAGMTGWAYADVSALTALLESDGFILTDLLRHCRVSPQLA